MKDGFNAAFKAHRELGKSYSAEYKMGAWWAFQHQQAKVEELKNDVSIMLASHKRMSVGLLQQHGKIEKLVKECDELQKQVKFLESELGAWKGKSIAAMINGMCGQCGKEPRQAIVSDKEGYALLHCFGCGANKYELIGEQALKGEG